MSEFLFPEFTQALSAKKHFFLGSVKARAQLQFHPPAWLSGIFLSICPLACTKPNLADYIRPPEKFQSCWSHFSKVNLLEIRSFSETAFTLWLQ